MSEFLSDIIEDVVINLDRDLTVTSSDPVTLYVECLKWVELFDYIEVIRLDDTVYTIRVIEIDREHNKISVAEPLGAFAGIRVPQVYYLAGTRYATNREWIDASDNDADKLPLVWNCFNPFPTEVVEDEDSDKPYQSTWQNVSLFLLDNYEPLNWVTRDNIYYKLIPLRALADGIKQSIINLSCSLEVAGAVTLKHFPVFGTETQNGAERRIIDSDLTAVGMTFDLRVKSKKNC